MASKGQGDGKGDIQPDEETNIDMSGVKIESDSNSKPPSHVNGECGNCVIINNKNFNGLKERSGTDNDFKQLYDMFENCCFSRITVEHNRTVEQMEKILKEESKKDCTIFVCVILSYGGQGYVYGKDGMIEVDKLVEPFKGNNSEKLIGKPKLFFIQACPPITQDSHDGDTLESDGPKSKDLCKIPVEADLLVVNSCVPGILAWNRDTEKPSWFIDTFTELVKKYKNSDVLTVLTHVLRNLAKKMHEKKKECQGVKLPYISSTLRTDIVF